MFRISSLIIMVASLAVTSFNVAASPINKCIVNGQVTYQQGACQADQSSKPSTEPADKKRPATSAVVSDKLAPAPVTSGFSCDGRRYCSQMKSCAEAQYFLANCPNTQMDGDKDGIPCEKQWCNH